MSRAAIWMCFALAFPSGGCGGDPASPLGSSELSIVGGNVDTTHPAVVTVYLASARGGATCTGTIVKVRPEERIGYVLTAAHCVAGFEPFQIVEGGDNTRPDVVYRPLRYAHHPDWNPPEHDLAVILAVGMDDQTPTMPMAGPDDGLEVGDDVTALGFGATLGRGMSEVDTLRHSLSMKIVAETPETLTLSGFGDTCEGDSGGPILAGVGAEERVVGVNSTGDASCFLTSDASRLGSGLTDFVEPFFDAPVPDDCLRCRFTLFAGRGDCVEASKRCEAEPDCVAVRACLGECDTDDCIEACVDRAGPGVSTYFTRQHCWCDPCAARCASEPVCTNLPSLEERRGHLVASPDAGAVDDSRPVPGDDGGCSVVPRSPRGRLPLALGFMAILAAAVRSRRGSGGKCGRPGRRLPRSP